MSNIPANAKIRVIRGISTSLGRYFWFSLNEFICVEAYNSAHMTPG